VALPSPDEAKTRGRALREQHPRSSLAALADRPATYDAVSRLMWQGESRVRELLALRYQRMVASPMAFYRGTALLMAEDFVRGPSTPLEVQLCGDAHLSNFNLFSSPERHQVFDVNDFDETDQGPFEWDLKRLVTSLVLASAHLGHTPAQQESIALDASREYRTSMRRFAGETRLGIWYSSLDVDSIVQTLGGFFTEGELRRVDDVVSHASGTSARRAFEKLVAYGPDGPRIVSDPPLLVPLEGLGDGLHLTRDELDEIVAGYATTLSSDRQALLAQFTPVDAARKVVGVGSVGTDCYVLLLLGRDESDPFFLQVKQASASVISVALGRESPVAPGERVVQGQRLMQATPDVFLGWHSLVNEATPRHFYVRQLYDNKASITIEHLNETLLVTYGRVCAWVLARAHARNGLSAEIAGYLGKSDVADEALAGFALAYRDRTMQDYRALQSAVGEGRITVAE
jgi:uncharacterized protein (DUF2252 family)